MWGAWDVVFNCGEAVSAPAFPGRITVELLMAMPYILINIIIGAAVYVGFVVV